MGVDDGVHLGWDEHVDRAAIGDTLPQVGA